MNGILIRTKIAQWSMLLLSVFSFSAISQVAVSVDWSNVKRTVDPISYGLGAGMAHRPSYSTNAAFRAGLKYGSGKADGSTSLIRLHSQGQIGYWSPNGTWDPSIIKSALQPMAEEGLLMEINFDRAIGGNGMEIAISDAVALLKIVNVDLKLKVKYWEIYNEAGGNGTHIKNCAKAMKAIDPTILVGGPAGGVDDLYAIARDGLPDIDYVSFHEYATGGSFGQPDNDSYDAAERVGKRIKILRTGLDQLSPNKHIAIHWNEYNWDWTWEQVDPRRKDNKGGVLFALIMIATVDNGGDISNHFDATGGHGWMNQDYSYGPAGHVFHIFNQYLYGQQVAATSSNTGSVVAYATKTNTTYSLCLVNRSASQQTVNVSFPGWSAAAAWQRHQVWSNGYPGAQTMSGSQVTGGITLPDNSVTILTSSLDLTSPYLQLMPGSFNLTGEVGIAMAGRTVEISNLGIGTLATVAAHVNYTQGMSAWITPVRSGSGNSQQIALQFGANLVAGTHIAQVVVSAAGAKPDSAFCTITATITGPDVTAPTLSSATGSGTNVSVAFSEPVELSSAQNAGNYAIGGGSTISAATLGSDLKTVTLTTSALSNTGAYTLTVNNIRDRATNPNTIAANSTIPIQIVNEITKIRFYPRSGYAIRMQNGKFEGTNGTIADGPWTLLHTIGNPVDNQWNEVTTFQVANPRFRIIRYTCNGGSGNVSEIEVYRGAAIVNGTPFGTPGSYNNSGNDYTKAWDGDISTFFDANQSTASTGIEIGAGVPVLPFAKNSNAFPGIMMVDLTMGNKHIAFPIRNIVSAQDISISIYNVRGVLVHKLSARVDNHTVRASLDNSDGFQEVTPQGQYVVHLRSGKNEAMSRFNIVR